MKESELYYMAGVLDSEGYIGIKKTRNNRGYSPDYDAKVSIGMNDPSIPKMFQEIFGGYIQGRHTRRPTSKVKSNNICWFWEVTNKKAVEVCKTFIPCLRVKKKQAEICVELDTTKNRLGKNRRLSQESLDKKEYLYLCIRKMQGYDRERL